MKMAKKLLLVLSIVALMVACVSVVAFAATGDVNDADLTPTTGKTNTSYASFETKDGWSATNSAVFKGGSSNSSPNFNFISSDANVFAPTLNGKTSAKGTLTSPTLEGGISNLTFNYGLPFGDNKVGLKITVTDANGEEQTTTISKTGLTKFVKYDFAWELNTPIAGEFTIKIENTAPSNSGSNKDRTAIWNLQWTSYEATGEEPVEKTPEEKVAEIIGKLSLPTEYKEDAFIEEDLYFWGEQFGKAYSGVSIKWTTDSENFVFDNDDENLTVKVPSVAGDDDEIVNVTATVSCGEVTDTATFEVTLVAPAAPNLDGALVPEEGVAYRFGMFQEAADKTVYIINAVASSFYIGSTTDIEAGATVYIENTDGGFYIYISEDNGATKTYINMVVSGSYVNGKLQDTPSTVYTFSNRYYTAVATVNGTEYVFGTKNSGTYTTVGPVDASQAPFTCFFVEAPVREEPLPTTPEEIVNAAYELEEGATLAGGSYTLTGVITSVDTAYDSGYGNITVTIVVGDMTDMPIQCFRMKGTGVEYIAVGDEITVTGVIMNYGGTVEFGSGCTLDECPPPITFDGAALTVGSAIDMMYYVSIGIDAADVSATFVFNGKTVTVAGVELEDGRYLFVFEGIAPHQMGDTVEITVTADDFTATDSSMSVRGYYEIAAEYYAEDAKLLTFLSDLLVYGAAAQTFVKDTDALVTEGLELTPSTTEFTAPETMLEVYGEAFKGATIILDHAVTARFFVVAEADDVIRVAVGEKAVEYNVSDLAIDEETGAYIVEFTDIYASEYDNAIWASIVGTNECVRYSVNSYINEMADAEDANLAALVKALYIYGVTADAYN